MIKRETLTKLKTIAKRVYADGGIDYANITNFETFCLKKATDLNISPVTIRIHAERIKAFMRDFDFEDKLNLLPDKKVEIPKQDIRSTIYPILHMTIEFYTDGTYKIIEVEKKEIQPEPEPVLWTGLFDYNDNKIIVRRGRYKGANVKNQISIKEHFGSLLRFCMWCRDRIDDVSNNKITIYPDTAKDVITLKSILKRLEINNF